MRKVRISAKAVTSNVSTFPRATTASAKRVTPAISVGDAKVIKSIEYFKEP